MNSRRTVVITGASDGVGAAIARALAAPDVDLIITGRSASKLDAVAADTNATPFTADFAVLDEVRGLAGQIGDKAGTIDVLINNAGGIFEPKQHTADGHEPNFQINHLAPFLLTTSLHDQLAAAEGALVLNTSSVGNRAGRVDLSDLDFQRRRAFQMRAYGTSKLMNILFARGIAERWSADNIVSAAVHPGAVASSFGRDSFAVGLLYRTPLRHIGAISPAKGAEPLVALAKRGADPEINGVYFDRHRARGREAQQASDRAIIDGLWTASADLVAKH